MPVLVHPSSKCDICLEQYSWDDPRSAPHALHCGHVYCWMCLQNIDPPKCGLCRKDYQPGKAKKLHVDRYDENEDPNFQPYKLLLNIALAYKESTTSEEMNIAANKAQAWLADRQRSGDQIDVNDRSLEAAMTYAVQGLHRVRVVQEQCLKLTTRAQEDVARLERENSMLLQDKLRLEALETALLSANNDSKEQFKLKVGKLEKRIQTMQEEIDGLTEVNRYFRETFLNASSSLPSSSQQIRMDHFPSFAGEADGSGRYQTLSTIPESPETSMARLRQPVMVPGAPPPMKVIPPHIQNAGQVWKPPRPKPPTPSHVASPAEQGQLEILSTRAGPANPRSNGRDLAHAASSSESLERVQSRAGNPYAQPSRVMGNPHGLELEGVNHHYDVSSSLTHHGVNDRAGGVALDLGPSGHGSQPTPRHGVSEQNGFYDRAGQADVGNDLQLPVFAFTQDTGNVSPGATPRSSTRSLPAGITSVTSLNVLGFSHLRGPASELNAPSQQSLLLPNSQQANQRVYSIPYAADSTSTWGTVSDSRQSSFAHLGLARLPNVDSRQSSFANLGLASLPSPTIDSQPPSANPSVHDLDFLLPSAQNAAASTSSSESSGTTASPLSPQNASPRSADAGSSRDPQQPQMSTLASPTITGEEQSNASSQVTRSSGSSAHTSPLNLPSSDSWANSYVDTDHNMESHISGAIQRLSSLPSASSSQSSLSSLGHSVNVSPLPEVPMSVRRLRPDSRASVTDMTSPSSSSLPATRVRTISASSSRANPKSSSQPSLPSSGRDQRPQSSRHVSMPVTPASSSGPSSYAAVGLRTGVPIYTTSPASSTGPSPAGSSVSVPASASREPAQTHVRSQSLTAIPQQRAAPDSPLELEQPRRRRRSTRNSTSNPVVLTSAESSLNAAPSVGGGGLLLTMEPPSTSSAANADGQPNPTIHAPRPVNNKRPNTFFGLLGRSHR